MAEEPTFSVERDGDRVVLVPEFWPSDLDDQARHKYDGLRGRHVVDDGALSMPAEYLPQSDLEVGSSVTLEEVWDSRTRRLASFGIGLFPSAMTEEDRDRIADELLDSDDEDVEAEPAGCDDEDDREPRILIDDCRV